MLFTINFVFCVDMFYFPFNNMLNITGETSFSSLVKSVSFPSFLSNGISMNCDQVKEPVSYISIPNNFHMSLDKARQGYLISRFHIKSMLIASTIQEAIKEQYIRYGAMCTPPPRNYINLAKYICTLF